MREGHEPAVEIFVLAASRARRPLRLLERFDASGKIGRESLRVIDGCAFDYLA